MSVKKLGLGSSSRCRQVRDVVSGVEGNLIETLGLSTSIVTGANAGIGKLTALHLANLSGTVIFACRSIEKANAAIEEAKNSPQLSPGALDKSSQLIPMELDLSSLESVQTFVNNLGEKIQNEQIPPLRLLVLNAGVLPQTTQMTNDGLEKTFQVNHFAHFLLTKLILKPSSNIKLHEESLRVVSVSSVAHKLSTATKEVGNERQILNNVVGIHQEGLPKKKKFSGLSTYGSSKLCNIYFAQYLNEMNDESEFCNGAKVTACSLHPGTVKTTIIRESGCLKFLFDHMSSFLSKNLDQGASTTILCCLLPDEMVGGFYFADCKRAKEGKLARGATGKAGRECIWKISEDLAAKFLNDESFGDPIPTIEKNENPKDH